jgi:hypothetical protein
LVPAPASAASVHSALRDGAEASSSGPQSEIDEALEALEGRVSALEKEAEALRQSIQEAQGRWDGKYAEYQRMLANSGGRLNRIGQAKVAKLDAEARAIKAEIEAFESQLAGCEQELRGLVAERGRIASRRRPVVSPPTAPTFEDSSSRSASRPSFEGPDAAASRRGTRIDADGAPPVAGQVPSLASDDVGLAMPESIPVFDPLDPTGGVRAAFVVSRRWKVTERFGAIERAEVPEFEFRRFDRFGRAFLRADSDSWRGNWRPADPNGRGKVEFLVGFTREERGLVRIEGGKVSGAFPDFVPAWQLVEEGVSSVDGRMRTAAFRVREEPTEVMVTHYGSDGAEQGSSRFQLVGSEDLRRPVLAELDGVSMFGFCIQKIPTPVEVRWKYGVDGRVAQISRRAKQRAIDEVLADTMGAAGGLVAAAAPEALRLPRRMIELGLKDWEAWEYEYDARGRLQKAAVTIQTHSPTPLEMARTQVRTEKDRRDLAALEAAMAADPSLRFRSKPLDGELVEPFEDDAMRITRRFELRISDWDELGRWTAASRFEIDEAGAVESHQLERQFFDLPDAKGRVDGAFQVLPASRTPDPEAMGRIARGFPAPIGTENVTLDDGPGLGSELLQSGTGSAMFWIALLGFPALAGVGVGLTLLWRSKIR